MPDSFEKLPARPNTESGQGVAESRAGFEIIKNSELLADQGNGDLAENLKVFATSLGTEVYAATDRGIGKTENHDRVVINTGVSQFSVLDGMGSAKASQILAKSILTYPGDLAKSLEAAKSEMSANGVYEGTCLISARLTPKKTLKISQVGDCGAMVFDADGKIKFSATSGVRMHSTPLEVDMKEFGIERTSQSLVDTTPAGCISGHSGELYNYDEIQLTDGDTTLLFSDALWSNFSTKEISRLVKQNRNPLDLFKIISKELRRKMQAGNTISSNSKDDIFSSLEEKAQCFYGGDHVPQADNQSLVLFQV